MKEHLQELKAGGRPMTKNDLKIIELQLENKELKERIKSADEFCDRYMVLD